MTQPIRPFRRSAVAAPSQRRSEACLHAKSILAPWQPGAERGWELGETQYFEKNVMAAQSIAPRNEPVRGWGKGDL